MSRNQDASPGRTETLIPLSRKALGDKIAIHADANSSYDPEHAIPVGRMLEDIGARILRGALPVRRLRGDQEGHRRARRFPIALGEQESSHARFRSMIRQRVADIVQPDLFYYGGLIRSIRVARMAAVHESALHGASVGRIWVRVLAALRGRDAEHRSLAGVQARASKPTASGSIRRCRSSTVR